MATVKTTATITPDSAAEWAELLTRVAAITDPVVLATVTVVTHPQSKRSITIAKDWLEAVIALP